MKKIVIISVIALIFSVSLFFFLRNKTEAPQVLVTENAPVATQTEPIVDLFPDDSDRDGIPNEKESELGLDPVEFDTDGDGLSDYNEINVWKTDPKKEDTDGDGFLDGAEIFDGYNPNGTGKL